MGKIQSFVTSLHQSTPREYLARMTDDKVHCMNVAMKYGEEYWDGDRRYGYGGYKFLPGRWKPVAEALISEYNLTNKSTILDIGCGKGYLLHELKSILPDLSVTGLDISEYGMADATDLIRPHLQYHDCRTALPFDNATFDLVISLGALHNFRLPELAVVLGEINRLAPNGYIMVESFRSNQELFNLQCWALTAKTFLDVDEWLWLYQTCNYSGDTEFIFFE